MSRYIDADVAVHNAQTISIQEILSGKRTKDFVQGYNPSSFYVGYERGCEDVIAAINATPAVDAVSKGLFDQIKWERDVAIGQLKEIGCELGQKMDDVAQVVRCKDCKYYQESAQPERSGLKFCYRLKHPTENRRIGYNYSDDDFCSYGERKEE